MYYIDSEDSPTICSPSLLVYLMLSKASVLSNIHVAPDELFTLYRAVLETVGTGAGIAPTKLPDERPYNPHKGFTSSNNISVLNI